MSRLMIVCSAILAATLLHGCTGFASRNSPSTSGFTQSPTTTFISSPVNVTVAVQPNGSTTAPFSPLLLLPGGTKRLYANVCNGMNTLDCTRPANIVVNWTATCGTLSPASGPYSDYTAPASGGPCTITATNTANSVSATATATLAAPGVSIDVIPAAITLYTNQYVLVQAVVTGSVNRNLTWSLTANPGSAGTLTAQGWTATFSASAAGTYAATATSSADGSKTAVITFYVTANAMPLAATANHTEPVDCTATGSGTTYEVGPARAYTTINAVPWPTLAPGDTVRIHNDGANGSPTTYFEKWLIKQSGTASQPIRVCGVPNGGGELPVIDATNATTSASYVYGVIQDRAPIIIFDSGATFGNAASYPKYITIEGLKITNEQHALNFVAQGGMSTPWGAFGAAIWMQHGGHVTIRGNDLEGNQQSLFVNCQSPESSMSRWLLFQGNYVAGGGIVGGPGSHQIYAQAFGQVIQGNYFGEPLSGMMGGQIKERCIECFTRYNYISGMVAGARIFDIVEPQSSNCLAMVQEFYAQSCGGTADAVAAAEDWYGTDYIYGNIVKWSQALGPVHYSADNCPEDDHRGTLYFYHNTMWENGNVNWRWTMLDVGPGGRGGCQPYNPLTGFSGARYSNNVVKLSGANNAINPYFYWSIYDSGFLQLDTNWISSSWGSGVGKGVDGDGTAYSNYAGPYQTGNDAHHITGIGNLITGTGTPFDTSTYSPTAGSPLIGTAGSLPAAVSSALPVAMQFNPAAYLMTPRANAADIGAIAF